MQMTLEQRLQIQEDIQEIMQLKAAYCNAADGGWDRPIGDFDTMASLYTEDGVWDGGKWGRLEGREAIREWFKETREHFSGAFHFIGNPVIKVNGDTATGEWHIFAAVNYNNKAFFLGNIYNDEFVRTPEGWKFKLVKVTSAVSKESDEEWRIGG
jgi:ketosteroid isomerase-like protein